MNTNRTFKDSVFTRYFSESSKLIELFNAIENTNYPEDTPVDINTLTDALFMDRLNDISFLLDGHLVVLVEYQSTINDNMPLRMLQYISRVYEKILDNHNIYKQKLVKIPRPDFIVLYNGEAAYPEMTELKLSDAFENTGFENIDLEVLLELKVKVYNINKGHNADIIKKSKALNDYALFIAKVRENKASGQSLDHSLKNAVLYCVVARTFCPRVALHSCHILLAYFA